MGTLSKSRDSILWRSEETYYFRRDEPRIFAPDCLLSTCLSTVLPSLHPQCFALQTDIRLQGGLSGVLLSSIVAEGMDVLAVEAGVKPAADFIPSGNGPFV
jgi:hypothetical protein